MLDLRNVTAERLGPEGLDWDRELAANAPRLESARAALLSRRGDPAEGLGWMDLPSDAGLHRSVEALAADGKGRFSDLVVLGIGGSSLGGLTVVSALQHPYRLLQGSGGRGTRVHFVDNVDGDVIAGLMEVLEPSKTLVNVISKSGTTTETMAAYLAFKAWLEGALGGTYAPHIVATTDPEKGVLRPMAARYGYRALPVPPSVGGRFSVLSPVGTFPALLAGVDVGGLLAGAQQANEDFGRPAPENDAMRFALANVLYAARGKNMTALMPYSTRLRFLSDWFAQLWAESLGKRVNRAGEVVHAGTTPVKAVGTTDQHSQVQLYTEGPNDKLYSFVRVEAADRDLEIPNAEPNEPDMSYLGGKTFHALLNAEQAATANALRVGGRPNLTWRLERLDAFNLGRLMQTLNARHRRRRRALGHQRLRPARGGARQAVHLRPHGPARLRGRAKKLQEQGVEA
jgi:glucose-6-phosphate isomerase